MALSHRPDQNVEVLLEEALQEELDVVTQPKITRGKNGLKMDELYAYDLEIIRLLGEGLTYDQVATRMGVTYETVKRRLQRAFAATGTVNAVSLQAYAYKRGLLR